MNEAKQKAIEAAYGEYYDKCKPNENGWSDYSNVGIDLFHKLNFISYSNFCMDLVRPKALEGLETNNNWISIESEDDLPEIPSFYWCCDKQNVLMQVHYEDIFVGYHTHYQPMVKPQPPIY